jgi:PsbP-like protein
MTRRWLSLALLGSLVVTACGTTITTSSPSSAAPASPTPAAQVATPSPTATAKPTPTAEPTPTPAPTPVPTPVPWASYASKRYHYSIKYPPTWVVTPGSANVADQIDDAGSHFVYLSRDTVSGKISLNLTVTHSIATIKSHFKAKLLSNKKITLRGWPGRLLTYNGTDNGRKVFIQEVVLAKGHAAYFIDMFTDQGTAAADKALFKTIYKTWKAT